MPTAQQRFSHCCPRDSSRNSGLIYSILLILKINAALLVPIHCQKKGGAGQDICMEPLPPPSKTPKGDRMWKIQREYRHRVGGGGALPTKVRSRGSAVRLPPGYSHRFNRPGTLRGPPCFSRLSPGRHLALLEEEGARLRISHVSFFFF